MTGGEETALASEPLGALWTYLSSWIGRDGGVTGPVVHRYDLKRLWAIHDTPWTQAAVIAGLLELHRRAGHSYWLEWALRLADAQCARLEPDGHFRWAGHEDDRFSSLVHNALADRALLDVAAALPDSADAARRERYVAAAERNLREYVVARLFRPALGGFAMNPTDHYAGRDRFISNMNAVAAHALLALDRARGTAQYADLIRTVAERLASLWSRRGAAAGSLPYSDAEPDVHVPLYTGLTLRGVPALTAVTGDPIWPEVARGCLAFLDRMEDAGTSLWCHRIHGDRVGRLPIFVAGAGLIGNGMLDAQAVAGVAFDPTRLAGALLRYQLPGGGIRSFVGYDHPDNGRPHGRGAEAWEDVYPTPGWTAQAFEFLCRVLPPPAPAVTRTPRRTWAMTGSYVHAEGPRLSVVAGLRPLDRAMLAVYVKGARHGVVVPGPRLAWRTVSRWATGARTGRGLRSMGKGERPGSRIAAGRQRSE
jgi:hypothetical protein